MVPVLQAKNICRSYKVGASEIDALKNINLSIEKGEFLAIVGKSGSGKSTLMHILGLLDTPTSGELSLNGVNVTNMTEKKLAKTRNSEIGFVFQAFNLLQRTTALDNVILPLRYSTRPQSEWKSKALRMLELVDLSDRVHNKSNELSGGQKQRVAIARALVNDPTIVLADEPTGNLDSKTGEDIINLFRKLNDQGATIVLVTHDLDLARVAKRVVVLKDGEIVNEV